MLLFPFSIFILFYCAFMFRGGDELLYLYPYFVFSILFGRAEIYSICFSHASEWLSVTSDKGTVHIFSLSTAHPNPNSSYAT